MKNDKEKKKNSPFYENTKKEPQGDKETLHLILQISKIKKERSMCKKVQNKS